MTVVAPARVSRHAVPPACLVAGRLDFGKGAPPAGAATLPGGAVFDAAKKPRALVVDDAPDVTEMLSFVLRYAGYEVVSASSAVEALEAARDLSFEVIVSDIGMPEMNGYELAERLRAFDQYRETPMIAVTGFSMYDDRDKALAAGFNAFLTKPVNPGDLVSLIERLRG
ncbi:MAG: response regulator [Acidobacteria bacterium]|nr:response regulator [Acidobacteriota bacterium]